MNKIIRLLFEVCSQTMKVKIMEYSIKSLEMQAEPRELRFALNTINSQVQLLNSLIPIPKFETLLDFHLFAFEFNQK